MIRPLHHYVLPKGFRHGSQDVDSAAGGRPCRERRRGASPRRPGTDDNRAAAHAITPEPIDDAVAIDTRPAHGKVVLKADGSFVCAATKDYVGTDTFRYKITSGGATSASGTVTITIK